MRITNLISGTMGLISGVVCTAVPMAFAPATIMAIGAGVTTYGLWHKLGKGYFAEYLAKQADVAIKAQKESFQQIITESVKNKLPTMVSSTSFVDDAIQSVVNTCLDDYATNPQIICKVLDDIDDRIPYENNALLKEFVNQVTNSIIDAKFSGCYAPLKSFLRKPLIRIVATVAANLLMKTTEVAVAKVKNSPASNVVNNVENLLNSDLNNLINLGLGLA